MSTPPLAPAGMAPGPFGGPQAQQAAREVNTATLCRIGQETVQDIVYRTMEIFQLLRNMQVSAWGKGTVEGGLSGQRRGGCVAFPPRDLSVSLPLALGELKCRRPLPFLPVSPTLEELWMAVPLILVPASVCPTPWESLRRGHTPSHLVSPA